MGPLCSGHGTHRLQVALPVAEQIGAASPEAIERHPGPGNFWATLQSNLRHLFACKVLHGGEGPTLPADIDMKSGNTLQRRMIKQPDCFQRTSNNPKVSQQTARWSSWTCRKFRERRRSGPNFMTEPLNIRTSSKEVCQKVRPPQEISSHDVSCTLASFKMHYVSSCSKRSINRNHLCTLPKC